MRSRGPYLSRPLGLPSGSNGKGDVLVLNFRRWPSSRDKFQSDPNFGRLGEGSRKSDSGGDAGNVCPFRGCASGGEGCVVLDDKLSGLSSAERGKSKPSAVGLASGDNL